MTTSAAFTGTAPIVDAFSLARSVQASFRDSLRCSARIAIGFDTLQDRSASLFDAERKIAASLSGKRRDAFTSGRWIAQNLQREVLGRAAAVERGEDRAPVWPAGCTGSITHSRTLVAAIVMATDEARTSGIDLEERGRVSERLFPRVLTTAEQMRVAAVHEEGRRDLATLIFSAKESVYKALNPILRRYIGFHEVEVMLDDTAYFSRNTSFSSGPFGIRSTDAQRLGLNLHEFRGYFWQDSSHVFTMVILT